MNPDQIREQIRYHLREIQRLNQEAAVHRQLVDGLNLLLWDETMKLCLPAKAIKQ
jgi:hypothetical protein